MWKSKMTLFPVVDFQYAKCTLGRFFLTHYELWLLHFTAMTLLVSVPSMKCPVIDFWCLGSSSLTLPRPLLALIH